MTTKASIVQQLDSLLTTAQKLDESFQLAGMGTYESSIGEAVHREFVTSARAAIKRIAGPESEFLASLPPIPNDDRISVPGYSPALIPAFRGSLRALREAVQADLLESLESRLRANIHDDFLQQAKSLMDAGYQVAGMVLIGGVLEDHLRKLCGNVCVNISGHGSLGKYNDGLLQAGVYDKPAWRRLQSIADIRNDAAHGNGTKVNTPDVDDAYKYVSRFLVDFPA